MKLTHTLSSVVLSCRHELAKVVPIIYVHNLSCVLKVLGQFSHYEHLYTKEQQEVIAEFLQVNNHLSDVEGEIENYERLEEEISALPSQMSIGNTILLSTGRGQL